MAKCDSCGKDTEQLTSVQRDEPPPNGGGEQQSRTYEWKVCDACAQTPGEGQQAR